MKTKWVVILMAVAVLAVSAAAAQNTATGTTPIVATKVNS